MHTFHVPSQLPATDASSFPRALEDLTAEHIRHLPAAAKVELQNLLDDIATKTDLARKALQSELNREYGEKVRCLLLENGSDTGTVHLTDGQLSITAETRKTVVWTQLGPNSLAEYAQRIAENGEDPADYIELKYAVSERKYNAWPETLKATFRKARTVKPSKPSFYLTLIGEDS